MMNIDNKLLTACIAKERRAQSELYKKCYSILMSVCIRYVTNKEEAQALLNAGFLKILNKLDTYQPRVPFEAWIRRIMINTVIDDYRKNKKHKEHLFYSDFEDQDRRDSLINFNDAEQEFDAEALRAIIRELPPMSQRVFNLYAIDGYSHKEISKELGISVGTSKWHVSFARKTVQKSLKESYGILKTHLIMRDQHELDNWLKQQLAQEQFEFDPAAWEAAEQLLDQPGAKRSPLIWWVKRLGILLLFFLVIGLPIFLYNWHEPDSSFLTEMTPVISSSKSTSAPILSETSFDSFPNSFLNPFSRLSQNNSIPTPLISVNTSENQPNLNTISQHPTLHATEEKGLSLADSEKSSQLTQPAFETPPAFSTNTHSTHTPTASNTTAPVSINSIEPNSTSTGSTGANASHANTANIPGPTLPDKQGNTSQSSSTETTNAAIQATPRARKHTSQNHSDRRYKPRFLNRSSFSKRPTVICFFYPFCA